MTFPGDTYAAAVMDSVLMSLSWRERDRENKLPQDR